MARKRWIGTAQALAEVDTITVGGTWLTSETVTVTIGGGSLVITLGTDVATTDVADIIKRAINATSATDNIAGLATNDETRNIGGQEIIEMTEVEATVASSVVTLTGKTAGVPFSGTEFPAVGALLPGGLQISTNSASGTLAHVNDGSGSSVRPTGPNWFTDAENWHGGVAPVNSDVLIFTNSDVSVLYGLNAASRLTGLEYRFDSSFTADCGLPSRNPAGYDEWRPRHLEHDMKTATGDEATGRIGDGEGVGSSLINLDIGTSTPDILILNSNTPKTGERVAVSIIGGGANTRIVANRGVVGFCEDGIETGTCTDLEMGHVAAQASDAQVFVGEAATVTNVTKNGGILTMVTTGTVTSFTQGQGDTGQTTVDGESAYTTLTCNGGNIIYNSTGACGTLHLGGNGFFDVSKDPRPKTFTNPIERYTIDSTFNDPHGVAQGTGGADLVIDYNQIKPSDTADDLGPNVRVTRGATA